MDDLYHEEELRSLFRKHIQKKCSEEELRLLMAYSEEPAFLPVWEELMEEVKEERATEELYGLYKPAIDKVYAQIMPKRQAKIRYWWAAAAAILLLFSIGVYLWNRQPAEQVLVKQDVLPGTSKATLILADGSVVTLDSTGNQILQQGTAAIRKQGGQFIYDVQQPTTGITYNTLNTPRGGQFRITLPDGTNVWLNAASSLRYPTAFIGKERAVEITGEAYFEVAKNASMPFRLKVAGQIDIEVLGTSFNVTAYKEEPSIKATLIEGAIRMRTKDQSLVLSPGQQAELTNTGQLRLLNDNKPTPTTAKDGFFTFTKADLPTVMRQLARWYDLEIIYEDGIPEAEFTGDIDKSLTLDQVLKGLARNRIHYKIEEGRKLIILP
jgi:transmembrane sensor